MLEIHNSFPVWLTVAREPGCNYFASRKRVIHIQITPKGTHTSISKHGVCWDLFVNNSWAYMCSQSLQESLQNSVSQGASTSHLGVKTAPGHNFQQLLVTVSHEPGGQQAYESPVHPLSFLFLLTSPGGEVGTSPLFDWLLREDG